MTPQAVGSSSLSSLVQAGLLPRLASHVVAVFVEATADDTEDRPHGAQLSEAGQIPQATPLDSQSRFADTGYRTDWSVR